MFENRFDELHQRENSARLGLVGYFGYGSLVNRATLRTEIVAAYPVRLTGWRRVWRPRPADAPKFGGIGPAVLTAERDAEAAIDGMLVIDRVENLAAVDAREYLYDRADLPASALQFSGQFSGTAPVLDFPVHIYEGSYRADGAGEASPILRSYLDAVLQGFHHAFGEAGVARFIAETAGFDLPFHEDRAAPVYPRPVRLEAEEVALFDRLLARRQAEGMQQSPAASAH